MMRNDIDNILDSLLQDWHCWCSNFRHVAQSGSCAMFSDVKSSRQWQDSDELHDNAKHNSTMQAIEFAIHGDKRGDGAMEEPYRTSISFKARNLVTGVNVWNSRIGRNVKNSMLQILCFLFVCLLPRKKNLNRKISK